jgi:hypothetical protein
MPEARCEKASSAAPVPRAGRQGASLANHAQAWIERAEEPGSRQSVEIGDVSLGGIRLSAANPPAFQELLRLHLEDASGALALAMSAEVRWIRRAGTTWQIGCAFRPPLSCTALEDLFRRDLIERRKFERKKCSGRTTMDWELGRGSVAVEMQDLSDSGFSVFVQGAPPREEGRLRLRVPATEGGDAAACSAVERWRKHLGDGTLIGSEFTDRSGFHMLREWLFPVVTELAEKSHAGKSRWFWFVIGALVAIWAYWWGALR